MNFWPARLFATVLVLFTAVYLLLRFAPPVSISSVVTNKESLFTVSGEGKVTVVPDTAIVSLGINVNQPNIKTAQTQANATINKIAADLKKLGIDAKDIKTSNYSIYPEYDYQTGGLPSRITGYRISVSLTVTVRDMEKINTVVDTATADGANTVGGIQLTVDNTRQKDLLKQARAEAIQEAQAKARELAAAAGLSLGRLVNIQESNPSSPRPVFMAADAKAGLGGGGGTEIQPGSTDIVTTVTLSYETR